MLNSTIGLFREPVKESLKNGKVFSLLAKNKNGSGYYRIQEYICYLKNIEINEKYPDMSTLTLVFQDGVEVTTVAYIDGIIEPNIVVSIYGYMYKFNESLQLACCLGVEKVFDTIPDILQYANEINLETSHIIKAVLNLSEAKESKVYQKSDKILAFKDTKFFYIEEEPKNVIPLTKNLNYDSISKLVEISSSIKQEEPIDTDFDFTQNQLNNTEDNKVETNSSNQ